MMRSNSSLNSFSPQEIALYHKIFEKIQSGKRDMEWAEVKCFNRKAPHVIPTLMIRYNQFIKLRCNSEDPSKYLFTQDKIDKRRIEFENENALALKA